MSHKAYKDLERRRSGLLAWSMRRAGSWFGNGGSDYSDATAYRVKRDGPKRPWRALSSDGTFLDAVGKLEQAKDACQRHYDKARVAIRERAVEAVDRKYGYTMEFSSCPEQHRLEYDEVERELHGDNEDGKTPRGAEHLAALDDDVELPRVEADIRRMETRVGTEERHLAANTANPGKERT